MPRLTNLAGETDRLNAAVTLKGLRGNTPYTLSVIAVNSNNYQSHTSNIPFFTQRIPEEPLPETHHLGLIATDSSLHLSALNPPANSSRFRSKSLHATNTSSPSAISSSVSLKIRNNRVRNNSDLPTLNADNTSTTTSLDAEDSSSGQSKKLDKSIYTVESLEKEVELVQADLQEILSQKSRIEIEHASAEQASQTDLEAAKTKRKADELFRAQLKSESKTLEETKHQLDTQRAKLDKSNKLLQADLERKTTEKSKWLSDIESAKLKVINHDQTIEKLQRKGQEKIEIAQNELESLQCTTSGLDDEIKGLASSTKKTDTLKSASIQALSQAKGKTDKVTGIINDVFVAKILDSTEVHSKLKDALKSELDYEKELEENWKRTQKDLETRYLKVNVMYSEAQKTFDKSVEMNNKPQGNESNLVYDAVAAAAAAAVNSNNTEFPGLPIAPTTSNLSQGKKRRRSRRNTKTQITFMGSPQHGFASTSGNSNSPMYSSTVPISPTALKNRSNGLADQSPEITFAPLTTSISALSNSNGTLPWDLQRSLAPSRTNDLQNPTALLPSYLLKDDLTESLSSLLSGGSRRGSDFDMQFLDRLNPTGRPSGGILGKALHKREGSNDSLHSAVGSMVSSSLEVSSQQSDAPFPNRQLSPQGSFSHMFRQNASFGGSGNHIGQDPLDSSSDHNGPFADEDGVKQPHGKGKFSSMFFFGKPRNQVRSTSGGQASPQDHSGGHSLFFKKNPHRINGESEGMDTLSPPTSFNNINDEVSIMGRRRRSGSLNSIGSLPMSLGESFNGSGMLNLWGDAPRPGNGLEPSRSHISTTLSIDRNPNSKVFGNSGLLGSSRNGYDSPSSGLGWSAFSNPNRSSTYVTSANKDDGQLEATWDHMPNNTISHLKAEESSLEPPLDTISHGSTSPQPNKGRFTKGFASLFASNASGGSSNDTGRSNASIPPRSVDENQEQLSLTNSVSDGAVSVDTDISRDSTPAPLKETILQKGIRTFSLPRKASASASSASPKVPSMGVSSTPRPSKFTMRRLSMFGKKDSSKDPEEELGVTKENEEDKLSGEQVSSELDKPKESMDFQEFLAHAQKQTD